jgi:hypothetical protein
MTIVVDPSIAKGQGSRQPSPPPSQPPPSYAESAATQPFVVQPGTSSSIPNAHAGYGPTPINQQEQTLLPYYDPRSVHSVQAAGRRARERFVGAVLWVILISALLSVLVWMDVVIQFGWSVSYCALLRAEPHQPLPFHSDYTWFVVCNAYYWLYFNVNTWVTNVSYMYLLNGRCSVRCALKITKKGFLTQSP